MAPLNRYRGGRCITMTYSKAQLTFSLLIAGCCATFSVARDTGFSSPDYSREDLERSAPPMGSDYHLQLFNKRVYREKVLPAYTACLENEHAKPLIALLNEIILKIHCGYSMQNVKPSDDEIYDEAKGILEGTVYYSPGAQADVVSQGRKTTRSDKRLFVRNVLAGQVVQALCVPPDKGVDPEQEIGRTPFTRYLFERSRWIEGLFTFRQEVGGGTLEIAISDAPSSLFTKEDLAEFASELDRIGPPDVDFEMRRMSEDETRGIGALLGQFPVERLSTEHKDQLKQMQESFSTYQKSSLPQRAREVEKQYDNLRAMVKIALEDPDLTILLSLF